MDERKQIFQTKITNMCRSSLPLLHWQKKTAGAFTEVEQ